MTGISDPQNVQTEPVLDGATDDFSDNGTPKVEAADLPEGEVEIDPKVTER